MIRRPVKPLALPEFIGLVAMLIAAVAFAIDAMLPALPQIAAELSPLDPNKAQLVLAFFVLGIGIGTLFTVCGVYAPLDFGLRAAAM